MKRTLLVFLVLILTGWIFVPAAHAQAINPAPSAEEFGAVVDQKSQNGQMSKEVYTVNTQVLYMNTFSCMATGCSSNPASAFYYGKSAIASMQNVAVAMYNNPPADLALWIRDTGQTLGFMPRQVNAQGIGFSGLSVLLPLWKGFRNIAYALLAVVMVVIGFMVMFRKKIDPKTVVTVQNALPKIVVTLLLITFSYAIVGFMIDLMYLMIALIASLLIPVSNGALAPTTGSTYVNGGFWNLFSAVFGGGFAAVNNITDLLTGGITAGATGAAEGALAPVIGALISIIVSLVLVIAWIRILFMLVGAYIQILISVLIGPLQILTEAFPGGTGFSSWFKNLISNIAVFPVTAAMLMVGTILANFDQGATKLWTPPLLANGGSSGWIGVIGLGILLTIPGMANSIKQALKTKSLLGGTGGGLGAASGIAMQAVQIGSMISSHKIQKQTLQSNRDLHNAIEAGKGNPPPPPAEEG